LSSFGALGCRPPSSSRSSCSGTPFFCSSFNYSARFYTDLPTSQTIWLPDPPIYGAARNARHLPLPSVTQAPPSCDKVSFPDHLPNTRRHFLFLCYFLHPACFPPWFSFSSPGRPDRASSLIIPVINFPAPRFAFGGKILIFSITMVFLFQLPWCVNLEYRFSNVQWTSRLLSRPHLGSLPSQTPLQFQTICDVLVRVFEPPSFTFFCFYLSPSFRFSLPLSKRVFLVYFKDSPLKSYYLRP